MGWRGAETWFFNYLNSAAKRQGGRALVCTGGTNGKDEAHTLVSNLSDALGPLTASVYLDGFNELQTSPELAAFLDD